MFPPARISAANPPNDEAFRGEGRDGNSMTDSFPHRLQPDAPAGAMAGCALAIGLFLVALGALPVYMTITHDEPGKRGFFYVVGGGFGSVGLLLVYSGIHRFLAMATPETIVSMAEPTLRRGARVEFLIRQPGPVELESLRVNLVGEERWAKYVHRGGRRETSWQTKHLGTFNFLDHGAMDVASEGLEVVSALEVPRDIERSHGERGDDRRSVSWKIEVWGNVRRRADFMHAFPVTVE